MHLLYNSDAFTVMQFVADSDQEAGGASARVGFDIVDKVGRREIYIDGAVAERFSAGVQRLSQSPSDVEDFDDFIESFTNAAHQRVVMH